MKKPQQKKPSTWYPGKTKSGLANTNRITDGAKLKKPNTKSKKMGNVKKSSGFLDFFGF